MKRKILIIAALILVIGGALLAAGLLLWNMNRFDPVAECIEVDLEGVETPVKILWISDLHIAAITSDMSNETRQEVKARVDFSQNSADKWKKNWPELINKSGADLVVFGGDIIDFSSVENVCILRNGLERLEIPYIYLRCDHDVMPSHISKVQADEAAEIRDNMCDNSDVIVYEFDDFIVAGWNNSSFDFTDAGLLTMRSVCSKGKPVLLMTHVPIEPQQDTSLSEASREIFQGRSLLWGYNDEYYWPEYNMRQFLDIIYADDSPIKEVFCGHLHFSWDGYLTDSVKQHVFAPALEESYGIITVK